MNKIIASLVAVSLALSSLPAGAVPPPKALPLSNSVKCPINMDLTMKERDQYIGFHAALSHLQYEYGKEIFEDKLEEIIMKKFPDQKMIEVSATVFERNSNLVDQMRLRQAIALTLGLKNKQWLVFEDSMRSIAIFGSIEKARDLEKKAANLLEAIGKANWNKKRGMIELDWAILRADAIARVTLMYGYLVRWQALNREIIDDRGAAAHRALGMYALGLIGGVVLVGTFYVSGPLVVAGGTTGASFGSGAVSTAVLTKVGEVAAGSLLGVVGSPAAYAIESSYNNLSEARKQAHNNGTSLGCEMTRQIDQWKTKAAGEAVQAALKGGALGMVGGFATMSGITSKVVLFATSFGVSVAQLYALGKINRHHMQSLAYYREAMEAHELGNREEAIRLLHLSRDEAQKSGEAAVESIIIASLTAYVGLNFKSALQQGETAIRQFYANSADTLPLAADGAKEMIENQLKK